MIIPTDGGLHPRDAKWQPMIDWLTTNRFDVNQVPVDALIEIRDGSCVGVEMWALNAKGHLVLDPITGQPPRRVEWHPMVQAPPSILLPKEAK